VWMNRLPRSSSPGAEPASFPSGREFVKDLELYARSRELPVQEGVTVVAVERADDAYVITTSTGCHRSKSVVVASGAQRTPKIPALAAGVSGAIEQLHVADYRSPERLRAGAVLVVGSGQSGSQIAEELLEAGRRVYIATSRVGRLPRRYRGRDTLEWRVAMGFYDRTPETATDLEPVGAAIPLTTGVRGGHTLSLQQLARDGAVLLGRLTEASGSRVRFADDLAENVRFGDSFAEEVRRSIDGYIRCARIDAPPAEADPLEAPEPCLGLATPRELDLRSAGVRTVLWATGFSGDFRWLPRSTLDRNGRSAHDNGIGRSPGLYVIGLPWLSKRKSGIVYGVGEDAGHIAAHLARSGGRRRPLVRTAAH
jgi:putative flavoprotein involved in K+ transport